MSAYLVAPGGADHGLRVELPHHRVHLGGVPVESPRRQLSLYTSNPIPGRWTLIIDFTSPVPGNELADPFTGRIRFNAVRWSRGKLPGSPAATLTRGERTPTRSRLDNTGAAPEDVFLDPRLTRLASYRLQPQDKVSGVTLPLAGRPTRRSGSCRR